MFFSSANLTHLIVVKIINAKVKEKWNQAAVNIRFVCRFAKQNRTVFMDFIYILIKSNVYSFTMRPHAQQNLHSNNPNVNRNINRKYPSKLHTKHTDTIEQSRWKFRISNQKSWASSIKCKTHFRRKKKRAMKQEETIRSKTKIN